jgi:hypothetical protein
MIQPTLTVRILSKFKTRKRPSSSWCLCWCSQSILLSFPVSNSSVFAYSWAKSYFGPPRDAYRIASLVSNRFCGWKTRLSLQDEVSQVLFAPKTLRIMARQPQTAPFRSHSLRTSQSSKGKTILSLRFHQPSGIVSHLMWLPNTFLQRLS